MYAHIFDDAITETDSVGAHVIQQQAQAAEHDDHDFSENTEEEDTGDQSTVREVTNNEPTANEPRSWSGQHKPTGRLRNYMESLTSISCTGEILQEEDLTFSTGMEDPICFLCSQSDTMYYDQAMKVADSENFREPMMKEISTQFKQNNWELMNVNQIPPSTKLLKLVWAMRWKWRITPGKLFKCKARLNAHGGKQISGIHYRHTYSPVVWFGIWLMFPWPCYTNGTP